MKSYRIEANVTKHPSREGRARCNAKCQRRAKERHRKQHNARMQRRGR